MQRYRYISTRSRWRLGLYVGNEAIVTEQGIDRIQHVRCPIKVIRRDDNHGEPMSQSLKPDAFRIVNMQVDSEGRWKLRGALPAYDSVVLGLIDDPTNRNPHAAEPASKVTG